MITLKADAKAFVSNFIFHLDNYFFQPESPSQSPFPTIAPRKIL